MKRFSIIKCPSCDEYKLRPMFDSGCEALPKEEAEAAARSINAHEQLVYAARVAKLFIQGLAVPQDIRQAAWQISRGGMVLEHLNKALAAAESEVSHEP